MAESKKNKNKKKDSDPGSTWVIEHYDRDEGNWKFSNLNAVQDEKWAREARVEYDPVMLNVPHPYEFCVELLAKVREQRKDSVDLMVYRLRNTENDQVVAATIVIS